MGAKLLGGCYNQSPVATHIPVRTKLLIYSDCYVFGGCENVVLNLLAEPTINSHWDVYFAYANNRAYRHGYEERATQRAKVLRLPVLSNDALFHSFNIARRGPIKSMLFFIAKVLLALLQKSGFYAVYNLVCLSIVFRRIAPEILYINNGGYPGAESCRVAVFAAALVGIKRVFFHVNNLAYARVPGPAVFQDKFIGRWVTMFVTGSEAAKAALVSRRGFSPEKIVNIANTPVKRRTGGTPATTLRCALSVAEETRIFGAVGLLTRRKGFAVLVDAVMLLKEQGRWGSAKVVIFGEGEERADLEARVKRYKLEEDVRLLGHNEHVTSYMREFDLLVLPSIGQEDFPYVVVEAMAECLPVIGSRIAGVPEQIVPGVTGWLVAPGDPKGLAEAMAQALADPAGLDEMGQNAKRRFDQNYAYSVVMNKYIELLSA